MPGAPLMCPSPDYQAAGRIGVPTNVVPANDAKYAAVILRSRALARRLEGSPRALVAHPSRLAVKNGEHLRMTAEMGSGRRWCLPFDLRPQGLLDHAVE